MFIRLGRPGASEIEKWRARLEGEALTYPEAGATMQRPLPAGYHHAQAEAVLGRGDVAWARAKLALATWQAQVYGGAIVHPPGARPAPGSTVIMTFAVGPACLVIPCRVVYTVDEPGRSGFGYGTLPGHPERGEESFLVSRDGDGDGAGAVRLRIVAFSRAGAWPTKVGGPLARWAQGRATQRYVEGVRRLVVGEGVPSS